MFDIYEYSLRSILISTNIYEYVLILLKYGKWGVWYIFLVVMALFINNKLNDHIIVSSTGDRGVIERSDI